MSVDKIIRAWKDEGYRLSLSEAERALLPANPAGAIELDDAELEGAAGGRMNPTFTACGENGDGCVVTVAYTCGFPCHY